MVGTALGITTDMESGIVDRFRSLPISRAAVLAGRTVSDLVTNLLGLAVTALTGLAVGWRIHTGPADALAALGLILLLSFAVSWAGVCLGLLFRSPEGVQGGGFIIFLPLMFVSNASVPTSGMPSWLQAFANWNPVSAVAAACRNLFGNPNPASVNPAWSMQHPALYAVLWAVAMLIVFAPLAVHFYSRKARR